MACCGKKRNIKIHRVVEDQKLLKNSLKLLYNFKDVKPAFLKNKTLLDYHRKTHMLYEVNIKRRPVTKNLINQIVELHDNFVKEMLKRNMKHKTPLKKV